MMETSISDHMQWLIKGNLAGVLAEILERMTTSDRMLN